jgi:hypothetical protein
MQKYNKYEVKDTEYKDLLGVQINNGSLVKEHSLGNRKKLYSNQKLIATMSNSSNLELGGISKQQFTSFLGNFNRHLYSQFLLNVKLFDIDIKFKGQARDKNHVFWDSMKEGVFFYNVDLSSAYWQMAHRLGYISKELFDMYKDDDSYKPAKRYCISFLARENKSVYIINNQVFEIKCDMSFLKKVYDNIRHELYGCIRDSLVGITDWIEYNIDGVSVMAYDLDLVKSRFKDAGLFFKVTQCRKMSSTEYKHGSKLRKFKKQ